MLCFASFLLPFLILPECCHGHVGSIRGEKSLPTASVVADNEEDNVVLSRALSTVTTYSCPTLTADPVVLSEGGSGTGPNFTVQITKTDPSSIPLCTLLHVTPTNPSITDLSSIPITSSTSDFNIVPVARSYDGLDWERVAGPYAPGLQVSNCASGPGTCSLQIPNLADSDGKFILMSFSHSSNSQERVSRFYHQTTFGPTKQMIDTWNYSADVSSEMTSWVKSQMDKNQISATLHRAYFRQHLDRAAVFEGGSTDGSLRSNGHYHPRHPCNQYARWREYSFTVDDYNFPIVASGYHGDQYLLTIRGIPRTVVSQWKNDLGHNIGPGHFNICWHPEEIVSGVLKVRIANRCTAVLGGNPRVNLPLGIYSAWNSIRVVDLPVRSQFGSIAPILSSSYHVEHLFGEALYLKTAVWNHQCTHLENDGRYFGILGNIAGGGQAYYAGNIELHENTLDNPMSDGGAALTTSVRPICPVPSRSFLNVRDSCFLSTDANACSSTYSKDRNGDAVLICGSPGETANNPLARNEFGPLGTFMN